MNSIDATAKIYDITDVISFTKNVINESVERLQSLMSEGVEFEKQKEQMQQTISELKEYKRALRKNVAKLICENEQLKVDYETQLKKKDSKITFLNDSVTTLETLLSEKSEEIKTLKTELDSYEIISEDSDEISEKNETDDDETTEDMEITILYNCTNIIINVILLVLYLGAIYWFSNMYHGTALVPIIEEPII